LFQWSGGIDLCWHFCPSLGGTPGLLASLSPFVSHGAEAVFFWKFSSFCVSSIYYLCRLFLRAPWRSCCSAPDLEASRMTVQFLAPFFWPTFCQALVKEPYFFFLLVRAWFLFLFPAPPGAWLSFARLLTDRAAASVDSRPVFLFLDDGQSR